MRGINKVTLVGNLGKDPDVQYLDGEIAVARFPLATTETRRERNGNVVSETEWHHVVLWRGLAELAGKYLHKGSLIYVEGRLRTRSWEDKDHNRKSQTEIIGESLLMFDRRKDHEAADNNPHRENVKSLDELDFRLPEANGSGEDNNLPF